MSAASRITQAGINALRQKLHPSLRKEQWYTILATASAAAHIGPEVIPLLYKEATLPSSSLSPAESDASAVRVQRRLKEALLKGAVLYGIPPALDCAFALIPHLREEAKAHPARKDEGFFLRKETSLEGAYERGREQLGKVYQHNLEDIEARMGQDMNDLKAFAIGEHRWLDMMMEELNTGHCLLTLRCQLREFGKAARRKLGADNLFVLSSQGWNLSESGVLDVSPLNAHTHHPVLTLTTQFPSTELVILSALVPMNLRAETLWHLRGCRRAGWSDEEIDSVRSVCIEVAQEWGGGMRTDRVPTLAEVKENSND